MPLQEELFESVRGGCPPSTRYQGSKQKLLPWIWENLSKIPFYSVLDAFGGTGSVSYMLKRQCKQVTFNDYLKSNYLSALALVENEKSRFPEEELPAAMVRQPNREYASLIQENYHDIYYTDEENRWLDTVVQNISAIDNENERALAFHSLFQSCIVKRPYNLFHRKNLYMRTADVERRFGNKATWDTPFQVHFERFISESNSAVFDSGVKCRALNSDVLKVGGEFDLVYMDPPYINSSGVGVDYFEFYHFLEGLANYGTWEERIDRGRKHRPLMGPTSLWSSSKTIHDAFRKLFRRFSDSVLVVSYRSDGLPSCSTLVSLLEEVKAHVDVVHYGEYKYVLSKNGESKEMLIIAQ